MFALGTLIQKFADKSPIAVTCRAVLQRDMDPTRMDELFNNTAEKQYEGTLLFSTCMNLMIEVTLKNSPSLRQSMLAHMDDIPVSFKAVYDKINGLEIGICRELIRDSWTNLSPLVDILGQNLPPLLPGYRVKMLDGNHFSATEKRLKGLRDTTAGPLPGQALAMYDPQYDMVSDIVPCKDGHASERTLVEPIIETLLPKDCIIADRNFCFFLFMLQIAEKSGFFIIRHHGGLTNYKVLGAKALVGTTETGEVYEQRIEIQRKEGTLVLRRITVKLKSPTGDGDSEIHILTNLPEAVSGVKVAELYRHRWKVEGMFQNLTQSLCCEIETLAYPSAAVFAFSLAIKAYNAVSLIKAAMRKVHGEAVVEEVSWFNICTEIQRVWGGMEIAIDYRKWDGLIRGLSDLEFTELLCQLVSGMKIERYHKSRRGPKKKATRKKSVYAGNHVSTEVILELRKTAKLQP